MANKDSLLTVRFEALGRETTDVTEWSITSAYTTPTDGFSFHLYDTNRENLRRLELQPVELLVDGQSQVLGRIDMTEIGGNGSELECHGRDYLADAVECNVDPLIKIKDGDTVGNAFLSVLSTVGIDTVFDEDDISMRNVRSGINVKARKSGKAFAKAVLKEFQPKSGEGQFDFLNRLIARFGATIQPGPERSTVVLSKPNYGQDPVAKIFRSADTAISAKNNVVSSSATKDFSRFPTFTLFQGWAAAQDTKGTSLSKQWDTYELISAFMGSDSELAQILADTCLSGRIKPDSGTKAGLNQLYRLLSFKDDQARTQEQVELAALRAIAERFKDTLEYTVTLRGHADELTGAIWSVDTIIQVEDEICGVSEPLWVAERTLSYSQKEGASATLKAYRPGSFQFVDPT